MAAYTTGTAITANDTYELSGIERGSEIKLGVAGSDYGTAGTFTFQEKTSGGFKDITGAEFTADGFVRFTVGNPDIQCVVTGTGPYDVYIDFYQL